MSKRPIKTRPTRSDFASGLFGDWEYQEALECYIDYLIRYRIKK